jgi:hypothetical protein
METIGLAINIGIRVSGRASYQGGSAASGAAGTLDVGATITAGIGVIVKFGVQFHAIIQSINKVSEGNANKATEGAGEMNLSSSGHWPGHGMSFSGSDEDFTYESDLVTSDVLGGFMAAMQDYMSFGLFDFRGTKDYTDARSYNYGLEIADKLTVGLGGTMTAFGGAEIGVAIELYLAGAATELATAGAATPLVVIEWVTATVLAADGLVNILVGTALVSSATHNMATRDGYGGEGTYRKGNKEYKKKDHLKGGKKRERDGDGLTRRGGDEFEKWFHRDWKGKRPPGPRKTTEEEIDSALEFWRELKRKWNGK